MTPLERAIRAGIEAHKRKVSADGYSPYPGHIIEAAGSAILAAALADDEATVEAMSLGGDRGRARDVLAALRRHILGDADG